MDYRNLRLNTKDHVAMITLSRPGSGNALDTRTLDELAAAVEAIEAQEDVHVVVLTGEGPNLCTGWDAAFRDELIRARAADPSAPEPFAPLAALSIPVVAGLQGR